MLLDNSIESLNEQLANAKKRLADWDEVDPGWTYSGVYPGQKIQDEIDNLERKIAIVNAQN